MTHTVASACAARPRRRTVALLLLITHLGGCYSYVPAAEPFAPGREVGVTLEPQASVHLADLVGPGARRVHGRFLSSTDSSLVVAMTTVEYLGGAAPVTWSGQPVTLRRDLVSSVQVRHLSRSRSVIAAALLAAGALAATFLVISGMGGDEIGKKVPPGPPDEQ